MNLNKKWSCPVKTKTKNMPQLETYIKLWKHFSSLNNDGWSLRVVIKRVHTWLHSWWKPSKTFFDLSNEALDYQLSSASFGFFFLKRQKWYFILSSCWKQFRTSRKARKLTIDCLTVVEVMTYFLKFFYSITLLRSRKNV